MAAILVLCEGQLQAQEPISKQQLLELVEKGVDPKLLVSLIERDCVDFQVDASAVLELADLVPAEILEAAIACRDEIHSLDSPASPPGTQAQAADISLSSDQPIALRDVKRLAVVPLLLDGVADSSLTAAFTDQIRVQKPKYDLVDSFQLRVHFEDRGAFHSNAPIKSLLAAARSEGADAIVLGEAQRYNAYGFLKIRVEIKIVEVNRGEVLWSGGARGKSGWDSWQAAKKYTARNAVKKLP